MLASLIPASKGQTKGEQKTAMNGYQMNSWGKTETFILDSTGLSPSSSSPGSTSAFLSLSCNITVLATETKVRFIGGKDKAVELMSVFEEDEGSVGAIPSRPAGAEADCESLEDDGLGMFEERSGEETRVFPRGSEEVEDGDLAGDFVSTTCVESSDLVAASVDGWEDWCNCVGLTEVSFFVGTAEVSLEMRNVRFCEEGRPVLSRAGRDPWLLMEVGVMSRSRSMMPAQKLYKCVIFWIYILPKQQQRNSSGKKNSFLYWT